MTELQRFPKEIGELTIHQLLCLGDDGEEENNRPTKITNALEHAAWQAEKARRKREWISD